MRVHFFWPLVAILGFGSAVTADDATEQGAAPTVTAKEQRFAELEYLLVEAEKTAEVTGREPDVLSAEAEQLLEEAEEAEYGSEEE